ncbi:MAG: TraB/GumN family protein [Candidatus Kapaibacterium sp.]
MKLRNFLIILLLIPAALAARDDKRCLWRVTGGESEVYMLGSIHAADSSFYPLDDVIMRAYDSSDALAVEFNVAKINPLELMQKAVFQDDRTLESQLPDSTYRLLDSLLSQMGMPANIYNKFKPWFAAITAAQIIISEMELNFDMGIDVYFLDLAKRDSLDILELESLDEQVNMLESQVTKNIDAFIRSTVADLAGADSMMLDMARAWKCGDTAAIRRIQYAWTEDYPEYEDIYNALVIERNRNMVQKIERYAKSGRRIFVVVGVGHLVGEQSIPCLLRRRGYQVEQL